MIKQKSDFISPDQILESIMYSQELQNYSDSDGPSGFVDGQEASGTQKESELTKAS